MQDDPEGYGRRMNGPPKYVASRTLEKVEWSNSKLIRGVVSTEVSNLKEKPGQDILVFGSRSLVQALLQLGPVDKLRLMVYPVVLGTGKRLFDSPLGTTLRPIEAKAFESGVVLLGYEAERKSS